MGSNGVAPKGGRHPPPFRSVPKPSPDQGLGCACGSGPGSGPPRADLRGAHRCGRGLCAGRPRIVGRLSGGPSPIPANGTDALPRTGIPDP